MPRDLLRMFGWLPVGVMFYAASIYVGTSNPQIQLLAWKLGHVCTFSWFGYWLARQIVGRLETSLTRIVDGRLDTTHEAILVLARALMLAGSMLARAIIVLAAMQASSGL